MRFLAADLAVGAVLWSEAVKAGVAAEAEGGSWDGFGRAGALECTVAVVHPS